MTIIDSWKKGRLSRRAGKGKPGASGLVGKRALLPGNPARTREDAHRLIPMVIDMRQPTGVGA
ncbi:MAG TPA: hypothetical protein PKK95_00870 [Vicinamibacterales bacterium]|nr:hypothetical protein [Acidobacteriota bacterium]HOC16783.1 hypothetical protein [Vicinamibacterales bacterium]